MDEHMTGRAGAGDSAPGEEDAFSPRAEILSYLIGAGLAIGLTLASFLALDTNLIWPPAIPIAIGVLAVAQMGVHLVFFLHISTGPDNTNNVLALAFGILIVSLVVGGSLWIMANLNDNMMPMDQMMERQP